MDGLFFSVNVVHSFICAYSWRSLFIYFYLFIFRKLFHFKEFYIIEILIVSYPNDVIVILISNCLIEITSIEVFCNLLCRFHMTGWASSSQLYPILCWVYLIECSFRLLVRTCQSGACFYICCCSRCVFYVQRLASTEELVSPIWSSLCRFHSQSDGLVRNPDESFRWSTRGLHHICSSSIRVDFLQLSTGSRWSQPTTNWEEN